ncbi:hypothetical protein N1851_002084 [Merluccius polli]|uniref:Uncharacterized protein n=1 Tax=Merluccius polli TaxID=89951 RepID=A0AA47NBR3_MERPO|nr:hypothetical protein N1851_026100 [Merluccius polli]KAK0151453.1 hypothetical protein N1851_007249 [Merluccius polli]KAK0155494.1 hypothetical protein N1851_002084 [Merluccius polli]
MTARRNVLETMEDCELIKRYRLNREGIKLVVELVRDAITSPTNRNNSIEIKCLATRYLATGKMQLCNADDLGISQPSVSYKPNQVYPVSFGQSTTTQEDQSQLHGMQVCPVCSVLLTGRTYK